jgi:hypothetical protein
MPLSALFRQNTQQHDVALRGAFDSFKVISVQREVDQVLIELKSLSVRGLSRSCVQEVTRRVLAD